MDIKKVITPSEPMIDEYEIYDDYIELLTHICRKNEFTFELEANEWHFRKVDGEQYAYYYRWSSNTLLTMNAYNKMLAECKKTYAIYCNDLVRLPTTGNCAFSGHLNSVEEVIKLMRGRKHSWLPNVYQRINEEKADLTKRYKAELNELNTQLKTLHDDAYLKTKIKMSLVIEKNIEGK